MIPKEQGIVLILLCLILIICYFTPVSNIDTFKNIGSAVEQWKVGLNYNEPGTLNELNFSSVQSSFPYYKNMPEKYTDNKIDLIKSDGIIVGGYMPQIVRPFDSVTANPSKDSKCNWPCYSDKKFQKWCSEDNAIKYHAMRPLIGPNKYNDNLRKMMKAIIDVHMESPSDDQYSKIESAVFCTESQKTIMSWLMQKIALQVTKMPEMQRNGSWKYEMFYDTDVLLYQYINPKDPKNPYFKVLFNLYNPLRSVSTMVYATIYVNKGTPQLIDMDFINNESMNDYMDPQNGLGAINGYNLEPSHMGIDLPGILGYDDSPNGHKLAKENYMKDPNQFDWNYKNTLEVQKFNKDGFYSNVPEENITIDGGIPDSLKQAIKTSKCKDSNLMNCVTPNFTGITTDNNYAKLDGSIKNVYTNPNLVYSINNPISLRNVETISGNIYI